MFVIIHRKIRFISHVCLCVCLSVACQHNGGCNSVCEVYGKFVRCVASFSWHLKFGTMICRIWTWLRKNWQWKCAVVVSGKWPTSTAEYQTAKYQTGSVHCVWSACFVSAYLSAVVLLVSFSSSTEVSKWKRCRSVLHNITDRMPFPYQSTMSEHSNQLLENKCVMSWIKTEFHITKPLLKFSYLSDTTLYHFIDRNFIAQLLAGRLYFVFINA